MRTNPDTSADTLPTLGAPIRPQKTAEPDPIKSFEQQRDGIGNWAATLPEGLADKPAAPVIVPELPEYGEPIIF